MTSWKKGFILTIALAMTLAPLAEAGTIVSERTARLAPDERVDWRHGRVIEHAIGAYHWTISEDDVFGVEVGNVMEVVARKHADGTVNGVFHYRQRVLGELFIFTCRVTCLEVYDGNRAKIGGVIELSNDPTLPPGVFLWFQAIDNGRGPHDPPDQSTIVGAGDEAANEAFCNSPDLPQFGPWDVHGFLRVRD